MQSSPEAAVPASERRTLLGWMVGSGMAASLVSIVYPILRFLVPPRTGNLDAEAVAAKVNELAPNSAKVFRFGSAPAMLVRLQDGTYRSFSAVCTHLNCTVQFRQREHDVWCACHNAVYDVQGRIVSGPQPKPLEEFAVHVRGQDIVVSRQKRA